MNDTDVQAPNTDCKPKLHKKYKLFFKYDWLITKMLIQEHVALGKIRFCVILVFAIY